MSKPPTKADLLKMIEDMKNPWLFRMRAEADVDQWRIDFSLQGSIVSSVFGPFIAEVFLANGGKNFVGCRVNPDYEVYPDIGPLELIIQRVNGKSPTELFSEAKEENDRLRAQISRYEAQILTLGGLVEEGQGELAHARTETKRWEDSWMEDA